MSQRLIAGTLLLCSTSLGFNLQAQSHSLKVKLSAVYEGVLPSGRKVKCVKHGQKFFAGTLTRPRTFLRLHSHRLATLRDRLSVSAQPRYTTLKRKRRTLLRARRDADEVCRILHRPPQNSSSSAGSSSSAASSSSQSQSSSSSSSENPTDQNYQSEVSQFGITWTFDREYPVGEFANGDYWVAPRNLGETVQVISISPDVYVYSTFSESGAGSPIETKHYRHGWEINPAYDFSSSGALVASHSFDSRINEFKIQRMPTLPLTASPGTSIVKVISREPFTDTAIRPKLRTAAVLTVIASPPTEPVFRPPYFGEAKPLIPISSLRTDLIPELSPPIGVTPSLPTFAGYFSRLQLMHKPEWTGREMHPQENMPDYGSSIAIRNADAALRLLLNDSIESKMPLLINFVQHGIDIFHMVIGGARWSGNGGHNEGNKLPLSFAAILLDDAAMKSAVSAAETETFGENSGVYVSTENGLALYGQKLASESQYWSNVTVDSGSRTQRDPYGFIDGGVRPGWSYQLCCLAMPWKATALAVHLMPGLRQIWNGDAFLEYADRWVAQGAYSQPDPCAPAEGVCVGGPTPGLRCTSANSFTFCGSGGVCGLGQCSGGAYAGQACSPDLGPNGTSAVCSPGSPCLRNNLYGVSYGPDGNGSCIRDTDSSDGIGRFPLTHGNNADSGSYGSVFSSNMWTAHR